MRDVLAPPPHITWPKLVVDAVKGHYELTCHDDVKDDRAIEMRARVWAVKGTVPQR